MRWKAKLLLFHLLNIFAFLLTQSNPVYQLVDPTWCLQITSSPWKYFNSSALANWSVCLCVTFFTVECSVRHRTNSDDWYTDDWVSIFHTVDHVTFATYCTIFPNSVKCLRRSFISQFLLQSRLIFTQFSLSRQQNRVTGFKWLVNCDVTHPWLRDCTSIAIPHLGPRYQLVDCTNNGPLLSVSIRLCSLPKSFSCYSVRNVILYSYWYAFTVLRLVRRF